MTSQNIKRYMRKTFAITFLLAALYAMPATAQASVLDDAGQLVQDAAHSASGLLSGLLNSILG